MKQILFLTLIPYSIGHMSAMANNSEQAKVTITTPSGMSLYKQYMNTRVDFNKQLEEIKKLNDAGKKVVIMCDEYFF